MMNRWMAAGVVALVFLSGVGVGSLATLALSDRHDPSTHHRRPHVLINEGFLERHLDLTAEQVDSLRRLREQREQELRALHPRLREQIEQLRDQHLAEVYQVLNNEQRRELEDLLRERQWRRGRRE